MASDGGPAYPNDAGDGMSVRDAFAKAIATHDDWTQRDLASRSDSARQIYDFAQVLTNEKLRRDKADRDEEKG